MLTNCKCYTLISLKSLQQRTWDQYGTELIHLAVGGLLCLPDCVELRPHAFALPCDTPSRDASLEAKVKRKGSSCTKERHRRIRSTGPDSADWRSNVRPERIRPFQRRLRIKKKKANDLVGLKFLQQSHRTRNRLTDNEIVLLIRFGYVTRLVHEADAQEHHGHGQHAQSSH